MKKRHVNEISQQYLAVSWPVAIPRVTAASYLGRKANHAFNLRWAHG